MDHIRVAINGNEKIADIVRRNEAAIAQKVLADEILVDTPLETSAHPMFSFAKIQKILHSAQNLSAFYYLCTNNSSNETKNKYTLHLVATFNVPIARSGSQ